MHIVLQRIKLKVTNLGFMSNKSLFMGYDFISFILKLMIKNANLFTLSIAHVGHRDVNDSCTNLLHMRYWSHHDWRLLLHHPTHTDHQHIHCIITGTNTKFILYKKSAHYVKNVNDNHHYRNMKTQDWRPYSRHHFICKNSCRTLCTSGRGVPTEVISKPKLDPQVTSTHISEMKS